MTSDPRKKYVVTAILDNFGVSQGSKGSFTFANDMGGFGAKLCQMRELDNFLDDFNTPTLQANLVLNAESQYDITLSNTVGYEKGQDGGVQFTKMTSDTITPANMTSSIVISSMQQSPSATLFSLLHNVYGPLIKASGGGDGKLGELLQELEAGLGSSLRRGVPGADESDVSGILAPNDEFAYWADISERPGLDPNKQERARIFYKHFEGINRPFSNITSLNEEEVLELLDKSLDALDSVWKLSSASETLISSFPRDTAFYPQTRMTHLLKLIGESLSRYLQSKLQKLDLWAAPFSQVEKKLAYGQRVCKKWASVIDQLTRQFWLSFHEHQWMGDPATDPRLLALEQRIDKVLELRLVNEELARLLTDDERRELGVDRAFAPFTSLQALHVSPYSEPLWKAAWSEYDRNMEPIEHRISEKLRQEFASVLLPSLQSSVADAGNRSAHLAAQPHQQLREFKKFTELLRRPRISSELVSEREKLLGFLMTHVMHLKEDFQERQQHLNDARSKPLPGKNLPDVVNNIVWVSQLLNKLDDTMATADTLLSTLPRVKDFQVTAGEFRTDLMDYKHEQFTGWAKDMMEALSDEQLALNTTTGRLMDLAQSDGFLTVHYSERLVTLLREVRQLAALGFKIPHKLEKTAEQGRKFYRYGVILKQVANFYNTMNKQIIPCQSKMLLEDAIRFEEVIKSQKERVEGKSITWKDIPQLEKYITNLQDAAGNLTSKNRMLRKVHMSIVDMVVKLFSVDLLRQRDKWREGVKEIKATIDHMGKEKGFANMQSWRVHWDFQLFKALEYQYKLGLERCHEQLPQMEVKLVFKQKQLQFEPPFQEIRASYLTEARKFISIPLNFKGTGDSDIFRRMIERNPHGLATIYARAESLFQRLQKVQDQFVEWTILGTVDLEEYVEAHVKQINDWDYNFKLLKAKAKDVDKLPTSVKVDCIMVNTEPVRTAVSDQLKSLSRILVSSLRKSAAVEMADLEEFLEEGEAKMNQMASSLEQISTAQADHEVIERSWAVKAEVKRSLEEKNRLLRSQVSQGIGMGDLESRWMDLKGCLDDHKQHLEEQKDRLRDDILKEAKDFEIEIQKFTAHWRHESPKPDQIRNREQAMLIPDKLTHWKEQCEKLKVTGDRIVDDFRLLDMPAPSFASLIEVEDDITKTSSTWDLYKGYFVELEAITGESWISFRGRLYVFQDFLQAWSEKLKSKVSDSLTLLIHNEIDGFRRAIPLLNYIKDEQVMTADHWTQVVKLIGLPAGTLEKDLLFRHLLDKVPTMLENEKKLKELHARAQGEVVIRKALEELAIWKANALFSLVEHNQNKRSVTLIKDWTELVSQVGDNQSLVNSLKDSPYFASFQDEASRWETQLGELSDALHLLMVIQRKWVYLEPIFGRGALASESQRFKRIDSEYVGIMNGVQADPRVISLLQVPRLRDSLKDMLDQLERCQKALADFLEEKRSRFPRFYFIGDDDLLEILGQCQNPTVILSHLKKLFMGIFNVDFTPDNTKLTAMRSLQGERVELLAPVEITEAVEDWMSDLGKSMVDTLTAVLLESLAENNLHKFPSQLLCLSEMVHFTKDVERALTGGSLTELHKQLKNRLSEYTSSDVGDQQVDKLKLKSIILDMIHNIDVCEQLMKAKVTDANDWMWQKQLRFYMNESKQCVARMCDAEFAYTYEYQGNAARLVHTPLTDKCYLTLTQGMNLGYGGNPYGPAGTGKTESVKALGQALGRQVLVFNCDEGIDFKSMGRIFMGLVKCGAWGCFDEFNRLETEVLSAISQQIQIIQAALKSRQPQVTLLGKEVEVNKDSGIFVTLNPAGKGYGGRSKLPDNLKQLFRSVAMAAPDNELIAEVILYSEGFQEGRALGHKLVAVFKLSTQLLTKQQHYDWGLRALKTVLMTAGSLLQAEKKASGALTAQQEAEILIRAIRVNTLAKLTFTDAERFNGILRDVFPGINMTDITHKELEKAIKEVIEEFGLQLLETQVKKIMELNEACNQRMGVVIVGPSGCGKSTLLRVLKAARMKLGHKIVQHTMNPKAIPRQQLLGHMDLDTREWFDGVLTASARAVVKEPANVRSWILCDGDIDPEWVESLNSVLDDNRLLTMPSGERIQFEPNVNFIFECNDLKFASPATVSRMGMIFLSDENMDLSALVKCWILKQPKDTQESLTKWTGELVFRALEWVWSREAVVETTRVGLMHNLLSHVAGCDCRLAFVFALIRGLGANLDVDVRAQFAKTIFEWSGEKPRDDRKPLDSFCNSSGACESYGTDASEEYTLDDMKRADNLPVVNTMEVQKNSDYFMPWIRNMEPFLLVGPEGCGKSMVLRNAFSKLKSVEVATVHCNAQTNAQQVIQKLSQHCVLVSSTTGRVYRPRGAERLILYLKDLNLPKPDKYNTSQLIAFLQQVITYKGFYDNLEWVQVEKVQIIASMNPSTTVGRHALSTRFTAIVRVACVSYPSRDQLQAVYSCYLKAVFCTRLAHHATWSAPANVVQLAGTMLEVYEKLRSTFNVDEHRHYLFTPRDLTAWLLALQRYDLENQNVLDVFVYEANRLFRDRLVGTDQQNRFDSVLSALVRGHWKVGVDLTDTYYTTLITPPEQPLVAGAKALSVVKGEDFKTLVAQRLLMYSREVKDLKILLFPEILDRVARLDRILSESGGAALLVGRSGVGRRTCTTLVCYMHRMEIFSPNMTRDYSLKHFMADLKIVCQKAGVGGESVCLYLEDYQLHNGAFLECVNSLLSSGEVGGMYTSEELDSMLGPLREQMQEEGIYRNLYSFFVSRIKANLHIVLSLDPHHPDFLVRCESNPALYTQCTILWADSWSQNGMIEVPKLLLKNTFDFAKDGDALVHQMLQVHDTCTSRGATPLQYTQMLALFEKLFKEKKASHDKQFNFLQGGLNKLGEAEKHVDKLSRDAEVQRVQLTEKQAQADQALQQIQVSMETASNQKKEVEILKVSLAKEEQALQVSRNNIEKELSEIQPILDEAKTAVGSIKSDNLNELRSLKMPPAAIRDVLEGVLRLMGNYDTSWNSMKKFLGNKSVKDEILNFDARKITRDVRDKVRELLSTKAESFEHANIHRVSVAASPLAAWVKANVRYSMVLEKIQPLEAELATLTRNQEVSRDRLVECESDLKRLDNEVAALKRNFEERTGEAMALKASLQKATDVLQSASTLLSKLAGEKGRWESTSADMTAELSLLPAHTLLAAAFITYLADAPEGVRTSVVKSWVTTMGLRERYSFMEFLSTESQRLTWKAEGLPDDNLSVENALSILNSQQSSLIIDPSTIASAWLQTHLKADASRPLEVVTQQDSSFNTTLELAVRFGKTLVITEMDHIEPILFPILRKDLIHQGPRLVVQVGDKTVDYDEGFRLFMVTRNSMFHVSPDARSILTLVNFSITRAGLEGQLLGLTIKNERPEIEEKKSELLKREEELKLQLSELERELLEQLAMSEGNILENKALIDSLNSTKENSTNIQHALAESQSVQQKLDKERNMYRPFAAQGSVVFFLVSDLVVLNHMYQFSLPVYLRLFRKTLEDAGTSKEISTRLELLTDTLKRLIFSYVCRSLFKCDRLTFGMHMVHCMHPTLFKDNEWGFFSGQLVPDSHSSAQQFPSWADQDRQPAFHRMCSMFSELSRNLQLDNAEWVRWARSAQCETEFPNAVVSRTTPFQQLLMVQALRPDRLESAMDLFCCEHLNLKSLSAAPLSMQRLHQDESEANIPILFINSPGADPSTELEEYATRTIGPARYRQLAMGQGQAEVAMTMLREAAQSGEWVCFKNVHLMVNWLPTLEKEFHSLEKNASFRMFMITEPHDSFPPILLQQSLKITVEAPPGVKKNLQRTYEAWVPGFISQGPPVRGQLLFVLAWFHAVVQERRTYIPQGWTKFYEFSFADLRSGADIIDAMDPQDPKWETIHGLFMNAIYGGPVDNVFDLRVLSTYVDQYFNPEIITLNPGKPASKRLDRGVAIPLSNNHQDFVSLISSLSDSDPPSLFGLPANIKRLVQQTNSVAVCANLKRMAVTEVGEIAFDRERWSHLLGPILSLWTKLSQSKGLSASPSNKTSQLADMSPLDAFVEMEHSTSASLLRLVGVSVDGIAKVVRGTEWLTSVVQEHASALLKSQVPELWSNAWDASNNPQQYLNALVSRCLAMNHWLECKNNGTLLKAPVKLSDLFHVETFLSALRQQSARQSKTSLDSMKLVSTWDAGAHPLSGASLTCSIEGLFIQGAGLTSTGLNDSEADSPTMSLAPVVTIAFVPKNEAEPYSESACVRIPVYQSVSRTGFLFEVAVPCRPGDQAKWILTGAAFFLSPDE